MKKLDYLKLAIQNKLYAKRAWIITAFSITRTREDKVHYTYELLPQAWGFSFINEQGEPEKIDDAIPNEPLFKFSDKIKVDVSWAANAAEVLDTTIGNLLFNHISILSSFGAKFPFVTGTVSVEKLEEKIAANLQDTPTDETKRSNTTYYVDEYVKFVDSLQFIASLSQLTTVCATKKVITPPKGLTEFKKDLVEKYKDKLHDPVELAKFEGELKAFDEAYMKDDPANGKFVTGRIKNIARKKMYLTMGGEGGFDEGLTVTPIVNSLQEGWPTEPEQFTAMMNGLRWGSYSRGSETVKGGVSAKYLLRAANNFIIENTDCGSKLGMHRTFDEKNINQLIGRNIIEGSKIIPVENIDTANNYLNRPLIVRSPLYCKLNGDKICTVCAGKKLSQYPTGVTIPLTEISAIILNASLKRMHGTVLAVEKLDMQKAFT